MLNVVLNGLRRPPMPVALLTRTLLPEEPAMLVVQPAAAPDASTSKFRGTSTSIQRMGDNTSRVVAVSEKFVEVPVDTVSGLATRVQSRAAWATTGEATAMRTARTTAT
jgi:hypothetical protein